MDSLQLNDLQAIIAQMPGLLALVDTQNQCVATNNHTAQQFGFKNESLILGTGPRDMRCAAVECADDFIKQNNAIMSHRKEVTVIDVLTYADGESTLLITKKKPYLINGEVQGVLAHATTIESDTMQKFTAALIQSDKQYHNKSSNERSYQINNYIDLTLTPREQDCLCYLVRGKTMAQIAELLHLSRRTIESHIESIKNKFGCNKKSDIIEIGILQGYLSMIPRSLFARNYSEIL